ncbi:hypothetical protein IMZ48_33935 [Candidatus Bathyarchaeota archaeon]|nr:hypothetical protein [Candidatus Bathyarchaeota archaeon]
MLDCLARYKEGTYSHWVVARDIASVKELHGERMEAYEKGRCGVRTGTAKFAAQRVAVLNKISSLQKLEKLLVAKGGKTFAELYPNIVRKNKSVYEGKMRKREKEEPEPYKPHALFGFNKTTDVTV